MRRFAGIIIVGLFIVLAVGGYWFYAVDRTPVTTEGQAVQTVLKKNLTAVNQGDVAGYLASIVPSQRAKTRAAVTKALTKRQTKVKLRQFRVQKQAGSRIAAKIDELQTDQRNGQAQVLEANVSFERHQGRWYIAQLVVFNAVRAH